MKSIRKEIIVTSDGSSTIRIPELDITYHSIHGAIQESEHVFIEAGLSYVLSHSASRQFNLLEMGLGTGLNAFLTAVEAERNEVKIHYTAIEQFPVSIEEANALNYARHLGHEELFRKIHESRWNEGVIISKFFSLQKEKISLVNFSTSQRFHLIYYDAFAPAAQPELWIREIFEKLFQMLHPDGVLVTYCSKGDVRRAMMAAGFTVKKLPGPPGKREMLRAIRINF